MVEKKPAGLPAAQDDRRHISNGESSYEITVEGHLDGHWSEWLGGLAIRHDGHGNTRLSGIIPDQAALHGILVKIRDMGVTLIGVKRVALNGDPQESGYPNTKVTKELHGDRTG